MVEEVILLLLEALARLAGEKIGDIFGRARDLEELRKVLESFFSELDSLRPQKVDSLDFRAEIVDGKLVTSSRCPIFEIYPRWCEEGCLPFIKAFASGFEVKRVERRPKSDRCVFEFSK